MHFFQRFSQAGFNIYDPSRCFMDRATITVITYLLIYSSDANYDKSYGRNRVDVVVVTSSRDPEVTSRSRGRVDGCLLIRLNRSSSTHLRDSKLAVISRGLYDVAEAVAARCSSQLA